MWSTKTITLTPESTSAGFLASITFQAAGETDVTLSTRLSSRSELENTITQNIARLNDRSLLIRETDAGTFVVTPPPEPPVPTAKEIAQREYDEALALFNDLKTKADLDPTTFAWGRDNQRVILQQKLQVLLSA